MEINTTSSPLETIESDGIIIWTYEDQNSSILDKIGDSISSYFESANFQGKKNQQFTLLNVETVKAPRIVVIGLGKKSNANHEIVRTSIGNAVRTLQKLKSIHIAVDAVNNDAQATSEGILLALYEFDELKSKKPDSTKIEKITFTGTEIEFDDWNNGTFIAKGQNVARRLAELPSNIATPTYFADHTNILLQDVNNVNVISRNEEWAQEKKMGAFLSVTAGSDEPAKFLEIHYKGGNEEDKPIVFVGKGITFDTGGISIKPASGMGLMRADCTGAACVIGILYAVSKLSLKKNVIGLAPLSENMPSGKATKPSDVVFASNGKSIEIDNTDAEGRLVLSDGLVYAESFNPETVIDIATLTGAMMRALGEAYTGAFTRSDKLWTELESAGLSTHERFWRMPLDEIYKKKLKSSLADLKNVGGVFGGASIAAMFLGEFIEMDRWVHLDIAGTMANMKKAGYKPEGIPGIPVRALIQFVRDSIN